MLVQKTLKRALGDMCFFLFAAVSLSTGDGKQKLSLIISRELFLLQTDM